MDLRQPESVPEALISGNSIVPVLKCCARGTCWDDVFSEEKARRELQRYRNKGPRRTTRMLIRRVSERGVAGRSLLDIGGGVGAIQHEMLAEGIQHVISVEGAQAYQKVVREEATARGSVEKMEFHYGNFLDLAPQVGDADIVTLDLVICCFEHMKDLVTLSAQKARQSYGLVFPRRRLLLRSLLPLANGINRLKGSAFRAYLHPPQQVIETAEKQGLKLRYHERTTILQVLVFEPN